jgi:adenylate cyclase
VNAERLKRKLSAILSADVEGYSRLMGEDEIGTVEMLKSSRRLLSELVETYQGRVVDSPGDNLLAEFGSAVDAVECAAKIQQEMETRNADLRQERKMRFRIGINLGDVIEEEGRIYGSGVNVAARMEGLAEGGGICISGKVFEEVKNSLPIGYEYLGARTVKNIPEPVKVYRILLKPEAAGSVIYKGRRDDPGHRRRAHVMTAAVLFLAAIAVVSWEWLISDSDRLSDSGREAEKMLVLPEEPSIAVLPFANMSDDPKQEYFSDGITEDIITSLAKLPQLFVIARNSTFTYKGKAVKVQQVGEELGVRYVLEGSVRRSGERVRITAQLIDATTGHHLWSERYDRDLKEVFSLQDEVTQRLVSSLALELGAGEGNRLRERETESFEAYDYSLRGMDAYFRHTPEANRLAREMFQKAIASDPAYALAYSRLGWTYMSEWSFGWTQDSGVLEKAFELARKAIALDDALPDAYYLLANTYLWKMEHDKAIASYERSIALAPNGADGYAGMGDILAWSGKPLEALEWLQKAMRLNPRHPVWYLWSLGHAYFIAGRYDKAHESFKRVLTRNPNFWPARIYMAVRYVETGKREEARDIIGKTLAGNPNLTEAAWKKRLPYKDPALSKRILGIIAELGSDLEARNSLG